MQAQHFYHIYNQGNNRQTLFYKTAHYNFFLRKMQTYLTPSVSVLAYCLMPNHFHILVRAKEEYQEKRFKQHYKTMLSSYTRAINKEKQRTGSLFRQNSKFKNIDVNDEFYPLVCFNYIHQNPIRAGLVTQLSKWVNSSYAVYYSNKQSKLIDKEVAEEYLNLPKTSQELAILCEGIIPS